MTHSWELAAIRRLLIDRFNDVELRAFCQDLGVDYETLGGDGKAGKALGLLEYCERRNRTQYLIAMGREWRPDIPWPCLDTEARPSSEPEEDSQRLGQSTEIDPQLPRVAARPVRSIGDSRIVVDPYSSAGFRSVAQALLAAAPGVTIEVYPGHYREALVIDKPVVIVGVGQLGEVVIDGGDKPALSFGTSIGRVANLRLMARGRATSTVDVAQGRLELEDCDVTGLGSAGVAVHGGADPRIRRCKIHDGASCGVFVSDDALGTFEDSDIWGHSVAEIVICSGAHPTFRRSRVHDSRGGGIHVYGGGRGEFEGNDIFGTAFALVSISKGGDPILRKNRIHGSSQNGVYVYDEGRGLLEDNEVFDTSFAVIAIKSEAHPVISRNHIHHGRSVGVFVYESGQGVVEDNVIRDNTKSGVEIRSGGTPTIRSNRIHGNQDAAILIHGGGGGIVENNDLRGNAKGPSQISADSWSRLKYRRNRES